jgi:hypothetical protein
MIDAYLEDTYLNTKTAIDLDNTTTISFSVTATPASQSVNRFRIVFQPSSIVLPVRFIAVSATRINERRVNVEWKTEEEYNMQSYSVERSTDGNRFTVIGTVDPQQNNHGSFGYSFMDNEATASTYFYRVRGNSIGGQTQYTDIVKVSGAKSKMEISVYPNPVADKTMQLHYSEITAGYYNISLLNKAGQEVYKTQLKIQNAGTISLKLAPTMPAGVYYMRVAGMNNSFSQQIMVK